jgi:hypothetical protein
MPFVPTTQMPSALASLYSGTLFKRADWIKPGGVRPVPPTPPPVVTPSGVPGPGSPDWTEPSRAGLPEWIRRGISPPIPIPIGGELPEWIRRGISPPTALRGAVARGPDVVSGETGPGWNMRGVEFAPGKKTVVGPSPAVAEKVVYDEAYNDLLRRLLAATDEELDAWMRSLGVGSLEELLAQYEAKLAGGGYTGEGLAQLRGLIDAMRAALARRGATQVPAGGEAKQPAPSTEAQDYIDYLMAELAKLKGKTDANSLKLRKDLQAALAKAIAEAQGGGAPTAPAPSAPEEEQRPWTIKDYDEEIKRCDEAAAALKGKTDAESKKLRNDIIDYHGQLVAARDALARSSEPPPTRTQHDIDLESLWAERNSIGPKSDAASNKRRAELDDLIKKMSKDKNMVLPKGDGGNYGT